MPNSKATRDRYNEKRRHRMYEMRRDPAFLPEVLICDTKCADAKAHRPNDLDVGFVRQLLTSGCFYCGETQVRMTLDRIDNSKGHTKDNVVPSCTRCNYTRGDMPYSAWLEVAKGMRRARELGLFGTWQCRRGHQCFLQSGV